MLCKVESRCCVGFFFKLLHMYKDSGLYPPSPPADPVTGRIPNVQGKKIRPPPECRPIWPNQTIRLMLLVATLTDAFSSYYCILSLWFFWLNPQAFFLRKVDETYIFMLDYFHIATDVFCFFRLLSYSVTLKHIYVSAYILCLTWFQSVKQYLFYVLFFTTIKNQ